MLHPNAEQVRGNTGYTNPYREPNTPWRICLHTVEGNTSTVAGMRSTAANHRFGPHLWSSFALRHLIQTVPFDMAASALAHPSGTPETNHKRCIQIEQFGYASQTQDWGDAYYEWFGEYVIAPICRMVPINLDVIERTYGAGEGIVLATSSSPIRYNAATWNGLNWITSHQRVPCVTPDTPMLCSDLVWRPAGDILVGDELIGFDENPDGRGNRNFRLTSVTSHNFVTKSCLTVSTPHGEVTTTTDHLWLTRVPAGPKWPNKTKWGWVRADALRPGMEVAHYAEPWETDTTWEAGWLAGMFDADGSLCKSNNDKGTFYHLTIGQRESLTQQRVESALLERGFDVKSVLRTKREGSMNVSPFYDIRVNGGRLETQRALGTIRPPRLLDHGYDIWAGSVNRTATVSAITSIADAGEREVASIATTASTFIAGGFLMHNCNDHWDCGRYRMDKLVAVVRETLGSPGPVTPPPPPSGDLTVADIEALKAHINAVAADIKAEMTKQNFGVMSYLMGNQKTAVIIRKAGTTAPWYGIDGGRVYGPLDFNTAREFKRVHEITENSIEVADPLFSALISTDIVDVSSKSIDEIVAEVSATDADFINGISDADAQKIAQQVVINLGERDSTEIADTLDAIAATLTAIANDRRS